ncbi:DUF2939 domain-containing protein [Longimicrobium sp.]|uniref:DUF2939 domain-containing protein n=1 Tax=Longimicrobium sp. TaxID=2029185 RepID=UPI003B3A67D9
MKKLPLLSLALCVAAAWLYFTPYMAVNKLQTAAERGDAQALNEMVDFPALRTSIRTEIQSATGRGIQKDGGVFAAIGAAAAGFVVGPVVDAAVTPEGISLLMKGQSPGDDDRDADDESWRDGVKIARRWEAPDRFVVQYSDRKSGDDRLALVMRREGLEWRLSGIRFPAPAE